MDETIKLQELVQTLKQGWKLIVSITLAAALISAFVSYYALTPVYGASTQLLVNQSAEEGEAYTSAEVQMNIDLINTYSVIITSPRILEPALEELGSAQSVGELREQITVSAEGESQVVTIHAASENPLAAVETANAVAEIFQENVLDIMNVDNVSILSAAELSAEPVPENPNPVLNTAIGFLVGLLSSAALAFLLAFLDKTLKTEEELEEKLGLPVLVTISSIESSKQAETTVRKIKQKGSELYGAKKSAEKKDVRPSAGADYRN